MTAGGAPPALTVAVLGLGEAGGTIARDLAAAGVPVRGYDPAVPPPPGVAAAASDADACQGAGLVLSLTTAAEAEKALQQALPGLSGADAGNGVACRTVYADANTASAGLKQDLAATAEQAGVPFADIAIMAPVPGRGLRTPMVVSGPAAQRPSPGCSAAAGPRSACCPARPGPRPPGNSCAACSTREWPRRPSRPCTPHGRPAARTGCVSTSRPSSRRRTPGTLARLEQGSYQHARRREHEMAAATDLLNELSVPPRVTRASQRWLNELATGAD